MKRVYKLILAAVIVALLAFPAWALNSFFGNPISRAMAGAAAKSYLKQQYPEGDLKADGAVYNFKVDAYCVDVASEKSVDSRFTVYVGMLGNVLGDDYDEHVPNGWNTMQRLDGEYRALADTVLESPDFGYSGDIMFGELPAYEEPSGGMHGGYGLKQNELVVDGDYDIKALGAKAGHLVIYVQDADMSARRAAEILLDIRKKFDAADVPFYAISFTLRREEKGDEELHVLNFPYNGITPDGLEARFEQASAELDSWYAEQDSKELERAIQAGQ